MAGLIGVDTGSALPCTTTGEYGGRHGLPAVGEIIKSPSDWAVRALEEV